MLRELARVTKPGGRVVVRTRSNDIDWWVNIPVSRPLAKRVNALAPVIGAGVSKGSCADSGLYSRLTAAGLEPLIVGPQFAIYRHGERLSTLLERLVTALSDKEARDCRVAVSNGERDGTLFVAEPFHCAVAEKPPTS